MNRLLAWPLGGALATAGLLCVLGIAPAQTRSTDATPQSKAGTTVFTADQIRFFETQVKPVLQANCFACHGAGANLSGGLQLNNRATLLKGGMSGPAVSLSKPEESLIVKAIHYDGRQMPPSGKMSAEKIEILTKWVRMGLPWTPGAGAAPKAATGGIIPPQVNAETMKFWAFQPVKRSKVPAVKNAAWVRSPIDAFILAKLEGKGLKPAPSASRAVLIRRAYYDLTGLPPTPSEVQAFLTDKSPNAWEKVVDRLLASPHYGERWGRHWLDLVRYAETNSFERDSAKPFVWRYRDYVINAFNADKPYDQFIREQLAGDELPNVTPETMIATGYYRVGQWDDEPADPEQARYDELDDIVATTGQTFLGLTINCARCHDHKLDPIPQKDYYSLVSFFQGTTRYGQPVPENSLRTIAPEADRIKYAAEDRAYHLKLDGVQAQIDAIVKKVESDFTPVEKEEFKSEFRRPALLNKRVPALLSQVQYDAYLALAKQRDDLVKSPPPALEQALVVTETGRDVPPTHVLLRGNPHVPGDEVQPAFLQILAPPKPVVTTPATGKSSGRRLALANWIASKDNQLTARVMMNRIWQYNFGRGIVRSSSNVGRLGDRPTHPELLDWLASTFVDQGWSLKKMQKLMLMSNTWKMSSQANPKALAQDPENSLFWRFDMRRLEAEEVRDSILTVDGTLNTKMFGPSIYPTMPKEVLAGQSVPGAGWLKSTPEEMARRSVYIHIKRSLALPILASFDAADTDTTCPVRFATTQPTQALGMINSTFTNEQGRLFAELVRESAGADPAAEVKFALWRVMQREPTAKEIARGVAFLHRAETEQHLSAPDALRYFCVVALNLNEFLYLD
ncbi:MAG: Planctomycete cytochrome [Chthonomonadaceae bacterium]|nr:Planctomycete cytochrome [Chthonomonadaceae bacterium]